MISRMDGMILHQGNPITTNEMKNKFDSIQGIFLLNIQDELLINGGGEPGYAVGYYAHEGWAKVQQLWSDFNGWRASNREKYGAWIG